MARVQRVTLLGGTGFIGRALALRLLADGIKVRLVGRHAEFAHGLPAGARPWTADVGDPAAMRSVLADSDATVYLPGRVQGRNLAQFRDIHAQAAETCARIARENGLDRFVFVSALDAAKNAPAWSDQTKAEGEFRVTGAFPEAVVVRPSVVLGSGDHFSTDMLRIMRRLPVLPMIGPATRLQPVHVNDVAEALRRLLHDSTASATVIQTAGPRTWRMIDLIAALRDQESVRCRLLALPR